jgi:hypothetical protein
MALGVHQPRAPLEFIGALISLSTSRKILLISIKSIYSGTAIYGMCV